MEDINELIKRRIEKLDELKQLNINPYPNDFCPSHTIGEIISLSKNKEKGCPEAKKEYYSVGGRIMSKREHGKTIFCHIMDRAGKIQIYINKDTVGEDNFKLACKFDIGDFIGINGYLFFTRTGELTIFAENIRLLCKSLRPLPEKWHGLKDIEIRYRQRYVDLIVNPEVKDVFITRSKIIQKIREYLNKLDFIEVETPMMQAIAGGAAAKPFKTYHNALDMDLYLRIAPELYLKRLVIGGIERVYEINRNFRNEGISSEHNPEFTMLEFYMGYADYDALMRLTEEMFNYIAMEVLGKTQFQFGEYHIDLASPWKRYTFKDALIMLGKFRADEIEDINRLKAVCNRLDIPISEDDSIVKMMQKIFDTVVEPELIQPTFIIEYPIEMSPLARKKDNDDSVVDRFELFIGGKEIANAYSELNDPLDQRERFKEQALKRVKGDDDAHMMDEDFLRALEYGMPPTAGEGIGIDRLTMLFTNSVSIRDVILFPQLRQEN